MHSFFYPLKRPFFLFLSFILSASITLGQSWQPGKKVVADDRTTLGGFGNDISISGNYAVIGAFDDNGVADGKPAFESAGAAYLFFNDHGTWKQIKKIYPPVRAAFDYFGRAVCIKDDYIIIGSESRTDVNEQNSIQGAGAAYLYAKDQGGPGNWGFVKKITSPNRQYEHFASDVAIDGDYIIAGAYYQARAYIFEKNAGGANNWGVVTTLFPQAGNSFSSFGGKVAISGDHVLVGAYADDNSGTGPALQNSGSAYIYKKNQGGTNNWGLVKKLTAPVKMENAAFGISASMDGDRVAIGAWGEIVTEGSTPIHGSGAAYLFSKDKGGPDQWGLEKKLTTDVISQSSFGTSIAVKGSSVVVGGFVDYLDYKNEDTVKNAGAAWVFSENRGGIGNWGQTAKIHSPDRDEDEYFGNAVALNDSLILVGSVQEHNGGPYALNYPGAAYSFSLESALPVKLVSFSAEQSERQAHLKWTTAEETNSSYFEIQRSGTGQNWTIIESIEAANESRVKTTYQAADLSPLPGENLYRLKMVDTDGTFAYSSIKRLFFDDRRLASFYPNPTTEHLLLDEKLLANAVSVKLLNQAGQQVFETSKPAVVLKTGHLNAGIYLLQVVQKDGNVISGRVVINK